MSDALPSGWTEYKAENGQKYYHNDDTNITQWERPTALDATSKAFPPPPSSTTAAVNAFSPGSVQGGGDLNMQDLDLGNMGEVSRKSGAEGFSMRSAVTALPEGEMSGRRDSADGRSDEGLLGSGRGSSRGDAGPDLGCCGRLLQLEFLKPYFDVSTSTIVTRLSLSLLPFRPLKTAGGESAFRQHPDLYGPFWVALTAVIIVFISGNYASYLEGLGKDTNWLLLSVAWGTIFSFWLGVPVLARLICWFFRAGERGLSLAQLICIYGYSFAILIPVAPICLLPLSWLKWLCSMIGLVISLMFILINLSSDLTQSIPRLRYALMLWLCLAQCGFFLTFRLYFLQAAVVNS